MTEQISWHNLSWKRVVKKLDSDPENGLTEGEVKKRHKKFGRNYLPKESPLSKLRIFLKQFASPLIYILVIAGLVTFFLGEYTDSIVIFAAITLNTIVGFFQEKKAADTLRNLKKVVKIKAQVRRDGNDKIVDYQDLVPGDIITLNPGDKVPADARIIQSHNLTMNEMALTGEWLPAEKHSQILPEKTPMADRDNIVYMGTIIEGGKGKAVVTDTGEESKIGEVAQLVKETKEQKTPLQKKISRLARIIGVIIVFVCLIIFIEGIITGNNFIEMFTVAVAVAVAAIPEGMPVALTVILALGMQRILDKKGLVRKLLAAETLGSTSIICTDKTKTLTEGKMQIDSIVTGNNFFSKKNEENKEDLFALKIASLANEAFIENPQESIEKWTVQGQPTDRALLFGGIKKGINKKDLEKEFPQIEELPFDTKNKYMATLHSSGKNKQTLYVKGAPEKILELSDYFLTGGKKDKLTSKRIKKIEDKLEKITKKGLRVVGVAYREIKIKKTKEIKSNNLKDFSEKLIFVGLIGLKDPLRKEVKEAIKTCRGAGMRPVLVTGDHKLTAKTIAQELDFRVKKRNIIEGEELDKMSDEEFKERVKEIEIYARVEPKHKMKIIEAWQEKGEVVAMTGDGINDSPALRKADIGVALNSGTEVAKSSSDLILLNDSFSIIVAAVEEGRKIIDNIRKVITYLLSDSFSEILLIGAALLFGFPLPISAVQILWVNLVEDGLPNIALAFEPKEGDVMKQEPQDHDVPLLTKEMKVIIFIIGTLTDLILLGIFFWLWGLNHDIAYVRTMVFAALSIDSLFYVFSCKSLRKNLWHINPFTNKLLVLSWIVGIFMLFLAVYLPLFQVLLGTVPLSFLDWMILFGLGVSEIISIEAAKYYFIVRHKTNI